MKRIYKKPIAWILAAAMAVTGGCAAPKASGRTASQAAKPTETAKPQLQEEPGGQPENGLAEGNVISGFTVDSISDSQLLQAQLIGFTHGQSGAKVLWIKNSDPELAFSISYRTPYLDETDTNHVFEHAIIASSEKYPSSDLFFDLAGTSYSTFVNAFTYNTFTTYPISSESEEQFIKLMDAYLSCMVAPDILKNENIFKREALRYELDHPEEPIQMLGTVYSEDFGFLTNIYREAMNNLEDSLYPGQYASNAIGRSHRNYQNLTYETVLDTYNRYYHFDNSLICLYGDMDYERVLGFIHKEYLSKAENHETDLSAYSDPAAKDGFEEKTVSVPAFEGDQTENAAQIDYAFSLEAESWEDLMAWHILTEVLNHENSSFYANLKAQGIQNQAGAYINPYNAKPYLQFSLYYGDPEQSRSFKAAVTKTLTQIAHEGVDGSILRSTLKQMKTSHYLLRDQRNVGVNVFPDIVNYWAHTGRHDYYLVFEQLLNQIEADSEQEIFRRLAAKAGNAGRSALVTNVPEPGLAEAILAQRDAYLAEMKASMSEEEIQQMIQDTAAFREWNESRETNRDFVIHPSDIPDEEPFTDYERIEGNGVTYYMAPAEAKHAGSYTMYLDISDLSDEEQMDLGLYRLLAGNMGTKTHSLEEILNLKSEYLYAFEMDVLYPDKEDAYPMMALDWITLTKDYEAGLTLLLEILGSTDFTDTKRVLELLVREADFYDLSRADDKLYVASELAKSYIDRSYAYQEAYEGQEFYYYLKDVKAKLENDPSYGAVLAKRLQSVSDKVLKKGRIAYACAAPNTDLEAIKAISASLLEALPSKEAGKNPPTLPQKVQKRAVILESSDQYSVTAGNCYKEDGFSGKYVPFLMAASDQYTIPKLRFQMGAYGSGINFTAYTGTMLMYSYNDPNAAETIKVFEGTADAIAAMELTQEELDGYILTAVSTANMARGVFAKPLTAMELEITGRDARKICDVVNRMKTATIEDQKAAAECFREILKQSGTATVGNEARLKAEQDAYDQLISYKAGGRD